MTINMIRLSLMVIWMLLFFRDAQARCFDYQILEEDCFQEITCSGSTLQFSIFEDCPSQTPIAQFTDSSVTIDDCRGLVEVQSDGSFGLSEPLNSEDPSQNNLEYCTGFSSTDEESSDAVFYTIDVNEFLPQPLDVSFQESLRLDEGTTGEILEFSYIDNDYEEYKSLSFVENFGDDSPFSLEQKRVDDENEGVVYSLSVTGNLDYERIQFYALEAIFTSCDVRDNCSSATQNFLISVDDVGDQPPTFINSSPFVDFDEGPSDRCVFTMIAIDGDLSVNNEIFYEIIDGNEDGYFSIDNRTGNVTNTKEIDREVLDLSFFALTIEALEIDQNGDPVDEPNSATEKLDINIMDLNDNEPTFDQKEYSVSTPEPEESSSQKNILEDLNITIVDMDEGYSGRYSITSDNANVEVSPESGAGETQVTVSIYPCPEFDYETSGHTAVVVTLTAVEEAWPFRHRSTAQLQITIEDVNDNYPQFDSPDYNADVLETLTPGSSVLTITATDADGSAEFNQKSLVFSIDNCEAMEIGEETGVVRLSPGYSFDYEAKEELECLITVKDMFGESESSLQNQTSLFLHVQDVDDEPPTFTSITTEVSVSESSDVGTSVASFTVEDPDTNSDLAVSLAFDDSQLESWFEVKFSQKNNSGTIVTAAILDREIASLVTMEVIVTDTNTEVQGMESTSEFVYVAIQDTNDEAPYFVEDYSSQNVTEESLVDSKVFQVIADDNDKGDSVTYSISDNEYLYIDSKTGWVRVASRIDREKMGFIYIQITALDQGGHSETVSVTVTVVDINDNEPTFADDILFGDFLPTSIIGDTVAVFQFEDQDVDDYLTFEDNEDYTWSTNIDIKEPFKVQNVDGRNGEILLNVDATGIEGYCVFTITATDQGGHSKTVPVQMNSISEDNIVDFVFENNVETVRLQQDKIEEVFTDAFGYKCITDYIDTAKDDSNSLINGYTLHQAHFLEPVTQEIIPKETIERQGSDGRVVSQLNRDLYPLSLACIGPCQEEEAPTNVERSLKISLGVVTLTLVVIIFLMLFLFIKKSASLNLQLKAMATATTTTTEKKDERQLHVPGSNQYIVEGTNPVWNVHSDDLRFQSDNESISSGGSILVGVEENPDFLSAVPRRDRVTIERRSLSACTEESA